MKGILKRIIEREIISDNVNDQKLIRFMSDHFDRIRFTEGNTISSSEKFNIELGKKALDRFQGISISLERNLSDIKTNRSQLTKNINIFRKNVSQHEGLLRSMFGKDHVLYKQALPEGISAFYKMNQKNYRKHMERFIESLCHPDYQLPENILDSFNSVYNKCILLQKQLIDLESQQECLLIRYRRSKGQLIKFAHENILITALLHYDQKINALEVLNFDLLN